MIFKWARHEQIESYLRSGWIIAKVNAPMHHHEYSFLCQWLCKCEPNVPGDEASPYHTHRRVLAGVPDGTPLCAECHKPHERSGQRLCRPCHNAYQRKWKADQARMAREYRKSFPVKKTVSGET